MRLAGLTLLPLAALAQCTPRSASVVTAPSEPGASSVRRTALGPERASGPHAPAACSQSWALADAAGSDARVLVVCGTDVRREPVADGPMARALDPALAVARERVCGCAARLTAPHVVDLVVTAVPGEGRARFEPGEIDTALDAEDAATARAFASCVGAASTSFAPFAAEVCGAPPAPAPTFVYSLDVEVGD